jgi:hypothetical protein
MRRNSSPTDRSDNFERRLKETMGSELEPEMVTPNTGGPEELTDYVPTFPLVKQFNQTNMRSGGNRKGGGQEQNGRDIED